MKVRLAQGEADRFRERLRQAGARPLGARVESDTFFLHPGRDFIATDEALRLRRVSPDEGAASLELTYKGPRAGGAVKVREEHNLPVGEDPTPLLRALGFEAAAHVEKRREPFTLEGEEVAVTIDHLDGVGTFAEVEVLAEDAGAATQRVEACLDRLGLADAPRVDRSYLRLSQEARGGATRGS